MFREFMLLLLRQLSSAFFLLIGLIMSMSWFYWKDSPLWLLFVGVFFLLFGISGVVFTILRAEEESNI